MPVAWPHTSCVSVAHSGQLIMLSIPITSVGAHRSAMQRSVSNARYLDVVAHRGGSNVGAPMRCSRSRRAPGAAAKSRDGHSIGHQDEAHAINGPSARRDLPARAGQVESDRQPPHVEGGVLGWGRRCGRGDIGPDKASRWWRGVAVAGVAQLSGRHNIEFALILCRRHVASLFGPDGVSIGAQPPADVMWPKQRQAWGCRAHASCWVARWLARRAGIQCSRALS